VGDPEHRAKGITVTSYSTYGVNRIKLVDGALHYDEETREEQHEQILDALTAGAARALLDTAYDMASDERPSATDWHSADEGWEIEALTDESQVKLRAVVEAFLDANLTNILTVMDDIAWDGRWHSEIWHGDRGMAVYRVGMLLAYTLHGDGIGFNDYAIPRGGTADRLREWVKAHPAPDVENAWIDSTEEPCLLHIG
jgi:hypothetical protein